MLSSVIAGQRLDDRFFGCSDTLITQLRQYARIALASQDAVDNRRTRLASDIADHMVKPQIHLIQGFLHMLNISRRCLYEALAVPDDGTNVTDHLRRPE